MEKVFRIRHIASGLFFKPAKDTKDINLSKKGKVYQQRPSLKTMENVQLRMGFGKVGQTYNSAWTKEITRVFHKKEWQLLEAVTVENEVEW